MKDDLTDEQKLVAAADTLGSFLDMLGPNDIYKRIFLEVLLEEIYGEPCDLSEEFPIENPPK
jgi:hypothetical protein